MIKMIIVIMKIKCYNCKAEKFFFSVALRPNAGHVLLIHEVSRSHTTTRRSR